MGVSLLRTRTGGGADVADGDVRTVAGTPPLSQLFLPTTPADNGLQQVDETTCATLGTWEYLPSVLQLLHPPGGPALAAEAQSSPRALRLYSDTATPVAGIAAVAIGVPLVTLAAVVLVVSWSTVARARATRAGLEMQRV